LQLFMKHVDAYKVREFRKSDVWIGGSLNVGVKMSAPIETVFQHDLERSSDAS
jgi:hypothetical protein